MSDTFNPGPGWKLGVTGPTGEGEEYVEHVVEGRYQRWFREAPAPTLPTTPYTVIRATLTSGGTLVMLLDEKGWLSDKGGRTPIDNIASFEVLSEPRAVTAKAVLDEVRNTVGAHMDYIDPAILDEVAADFGVDQ